MTVNLTHKLYQVLEIERGKTKRELKVIEITNSGERDLATMAVVELNGSDMDPITGAIFQYEGYKEIFPGTLPGLLIKMGNRQRKSNVALCYLQSDYHLHLTRRIENG
ncbi:MAG: hypothetical protein CMH64_00515 [Nanoarchaeota archaeon]|nr:hypothetical protein [Nanoarchaeota archaeon]|tara:strand:+ start:791 stop:1114 length:324 start_codon:yes stop_codon:yes gene_type:complete